MGKVIGSLIALVVIGTPVAIWNYRCDTINPHTVSGTVQSRYIKSYGSGRNKTDRSVVEIEKENGEVEIVQCRDSIWAMDFRSADRYAQLKEGNKVNLEVAGWRNGWFSSFARVTKINKVEKSK